MFHPDQIERIDHSAPPPRSDSDGDAPPLTHAPSDLRRRLSSPRASLGGGADLHVGSPGRHHLGSTPQGAGALLDRIAADHAAGMQQHADGGGRMDMGGMGMGGDMAFGAAAGGGAFMHADDAALAAAEDGSFRPSLAGSMPQGNSSSGGGAGPARRPSHVRLGGAKAGKKKAVPAAHLVRTWLRIDEHGETNMVPAEKYKLTHKLGVQVGLQSWGWCRLGLVEGRKGGRWAGWQQQCAVSARPLSSAQPTCHIPCDPPLDPAPLPLQTAPTQRAATCASWTPPSPPPTPAPSSAARRRWSSTWSTSRSSSPPTACWS